MKYLNIILRTCISFNASTYPSRNIYLIPKFSLFGVYNIFSSTNSLESLAFSNEPILSLAWLYVPIFRAIPTPISEEFAMVQSRCKMKIYFAHRSKYLANHAISTVISFMTTKSPIIFVVQKLTWFWITKVGACGMNRVAKYFQTVIIQKKGFCRRYCWMNEFCVQILKLTFSNHQECSIVENGHNY